MFFNKNRVKNQMQNQMRNQIQNQIKNQKKRLFLEQHKQFMENTGKKIFENFKNIKSTCSESNKNTILLIEPRITDDIIFILNNTYKKLGNNNWAYVFYCGKNSKSYWENRLPKFIELRELDVCDFGNTYNYSDFCKKKDLWESLYGEFVLTIQVDTWIMNKNPFNIDFFMKLNKSFIGGNMEYEWDELKKYSIYPKIRNFNGGLSLRKRLDMINIINSFSPLKSNGNKTSFQSDQEDVYFVCGCYKLGYKVGDDEPSSHFSLHTIYKNDYFGIHQPNENVRKNLNIKNPFLKYMNRHLRLQN